MNSDSLLINLGCGTKTHAAWVNIDYYRGAFLKKVPFIRRFFTVPLPANYLNHNLRYGIPFLDNSALAVYSSHLFEHLDSNVVGPFCKEQLRVLKPGGILRIVVPDLEAAAVRYLAGLERCRREGSAGQLEHEWGIIYLIDQFVRVRSGGQMKTWLQTNRNTELVRRMDGIWREIAEDPNHGDDSQLRRLAIWLFDKDDPAKTGELHRWMYDEVSLRRLMEAAGFRDVKRMSPDDSSIPLWQNYHLDRGADGQVHQPGSLYMEGLK